MNYSDFRRERLNRIKTVDVWRRTIINAHPLVMVTLGTNKPMREDNLKRHVSRVLFDLDCKRLGQPERPCRRIKPNSNPSTRTAAFIIAEKIDTNAHVHIMIYSPLLNRNPDSQLINRIQRTRILDDFIGYGRTYDNRSSYQDERESAPYLETLWRNLVPGAHYHARWTDHNLLDGVDYILKELKFNPDRDVSLSQEYWSKGQQTNASPFL